jgi:hypothetical protein
MSSNTKDTANNGAVLNISQLIKSVMSFVAEATLNVLYMNASKAIPQCQLLQEMGHPQPPTPIQTDGITALGGANSNIQPQKTKAMDMQFHWL